MGLTNKDTEYRPLKDCVGKVGICPVVTNVKDNITRNDKNEIICNHPEPLANNNIINNFENVIDLIEQAECNIEVFNDDKNSCCNNKEFEELVCASLKVILEKINNIETILRTKNE